MTTALNHAADNAGFLEKTGAKLGQLVSFGKLAMALAAMPPRLLILKRRLR